MGWIYLMLAGLFEVAFTTAMRHIDWSLRPLPIAALIGFTALSMCLLLAAMQTISVGTAYAVWTGIGAAGTVLIGIIWYSESTDALRLGLLGVLIATIVALKFVDNS